MSLTPPLKRPRPPHPTPPCKHPRLSVPPSDRILHLIIHHLTTPPQNPPPSMLSPHMHALRSSAYLRLVSRAYRDAFDDHVTSFDFTNLPPGAILSALTHALPKYRNLASLTLTPASTDRALEAPWDAYLSSSPRSLRVLRVDGADALSRIAARVAAASSPRLELLHVAAASPHATTAVLAAAALCDGCVTTVGALLDGVDVRVLAGFGGLHVLRALYRSGAAHGAESVARLARALGAASGLRRVELRVHGLGGGAEGFVRGLAGVPRLRKISLFGAEGRVRLGWLASCAFLAEVQLEWVEGVGDEDVEELTRMMGARLARLRIWNCSALTDAALQAVAFSCPEVQVELKFEWGQFSERAIQGIARVEWEAWGAGGGL